MLTALLSRCGCGAKDRLCCARQAPFSQPRFSLRFTTKRLSEQPGRWRMAVGTKKHTRQGGASPGNIPGGLAT